MKQPGFTYRRSWSVQYRGCWFDSLLELRFVLSIEKDYRFLREPVAIWYDPATLLTTSYHREGIKTYTPDLLIRHKQSEEAYLIELKPDGFNDMEKLQRYAVIAGKYIQEHGYDWNFKLVTYSDIRLTPVGETLYQSLADKRSMFQRRRVQLREDQTHHAGAITHKKMVPLSPEEKWGHRTYAHWVKRGSQPK